LYRARYNFWGRLYYALGLPAAIFAVLAGTAALGKLSNQGSIDWMVVVPAVASAILGAAVTFLKSDERRDRERALMVGWMELGDRVQAALAECELNSNDDGLLSRSAEIGLLPCLIELNKAKCLLLSGKLRAGPESDQGIVPSKRKSEPETLDESSGGKPNELSAEKDPKKPHEPAEEGTLGFVA
jgi:hypothetical protein